MPGDSTGGSRCKQEPHHRSGGKNENQRHPDERNIAKLRSHERWAHFRFSVIGSLLAAPPARGELQEQLQELAAKKWRHPISGQWVLFGLSTIERWYYKALRSQSRAGGRAQTQDPLRSRAASVGEPQAARAAAAATPAASQLELPTPFRQPGGGGRTSSPKPAPMPSYVSVLRCMKSHGLFKRPRRGPVHSPGAQAAEHRYESPGGAQLRERICQRALAPGFSSRLLARAAGRRPMGLSDLAGRPG